jgi:perosamine synthetase
VSKCQIQFFFGLTHLYNAVFSKMDKVIVPDQLDGVESGWHLYMIQLKLGKLKLTRREIFECLRTENIGVHVHYIPVYWHPYYRQLGYQKGLCPIAEKWYEHALTLPIFPKMMKSDVEDVINAISKYIN